MRYNTTITPKYQVHIPSEVRRKIGLVSHGRASIYAEGSRIVIEPAQGSLLSLAGVFRVSKPIAAEQIRKMIPYDAEEKK